MRWPRYSEIAIGVWLLVSPLVLAGGAVVPVLAGAATIALAAGACRSGGKVHLLILIVAVTIAGFGWARAVLGAPDPANQNLLLSGGCLAMFAVLPTRAAEPPPEWS